MNEKTKAGKMTQLWRSGILVAFCLVFLGGIKVEKMSRSTLVQEQTGFAVTVVAAESNGSRAQWRDVAEKHPELIIRAASSEFRF